MRHQVRAIASKVTDDERTLEDLELMTAEGLANALLHGSGVIRVELYTEAHRLRVEIYDQGPRATNGTDPRDRGDFRRGLLIIEAYAAKWSLTLEPGCTCLWFEIGCDVEAQTSPRSAPPQGGEAVAGSGTSPDAAGHGLNN